MGLCNIITLLTVPVHAYVHHTVYTLQDLCSVQPISKYRAERAPLTFSISFVCAQTLQQVTSGSNNRVLYRSTYETSQFIWSTIQHEYIHVYSGTITI